MRIVQCNCIATRNVMQIALELYECWRAARHQLLWTQCWSTVFLKSATGPFEPCAPPQSLRLRLNVSCATHRSSWLVQGPSHDRYMKWSLSGFFMVSLSGRNECLSTQSARTSQFAQRWSVWMTFCGYGVESHHSKGSKVMSAWHMEDCRRLND